MGAAPGSARAHARGGQSRGGTDPPACRGPRPRLLEGASVHDIPLITAVIAYARRRSEPYLFNHAMRSWLFAEAIGRLKAIDYDQEVVAIGTILHDIGLAASVSGPNRFEVNG